MPAIDWGDSAKMGYLSRAWPAPTCCVYSFLSNYLILKTLYVRLQFIDKWVTIALFLLKLIVKQQRPPSVGTSAFPVLPRLPIRPPNIPQRQDEGHQVAQDHANLPSPMLVAPKTGIRQYFRQPQGWLP